MRQIAEVVLIGLLAGLSLILFEGSLLFDRITQAGAFHPPALTFPFHDPSSFATSDDPDARDSYIRKMEADPVTGIVPLGIREKEVLFARRIYQEQTQRHEARSAAAGWHDNGPFNVGGRTRAVGVDVRNKDIILAGGVSGGMWRSEDGGRNWIKVTHPLSLHSVSCIVQDVRPGKEDHWYYGTGEIVGNSAGRNDAPYRGDGIFHSSDNGKSWRHMNSTSSNEPQYFHSQFQYVFDIAIHPSLPQRDELFVAAVGAIFCSEDGGDTWSVTLGKDYRSYPGFDLSRSNLSRFVSLSQSKDGSYYAVFSREGVRGPGFTSSDRGIYRSEDGHEWKEITPRNWPDWYGRTVVGLSKSSPEVVYFFTDAIKEMIWKYQFIRKNGLDFIGLWTDLSEAVPSFGQPVGDLNSQGSYNMVIAVHPEDENVVYVGGTNLYRSLNGFADRTMTSWIGGYDTVNNVSKYPNHFVDQHDLEFMPDDPDHMICANDGGVYLTSDNRANFVNWQPLNNGYLTSQFFTLAIEPFSGNKNVIGGLMDNGIYIAGSPTANTFWVPLVGGDGGYCMITKGGAYYYASTQNSRILRFTLDNNMKYTTFARVDPIGGGEQPGQEYLFVNPFVLAPENQNVMYLAGGDRIWRNDNLSQVPLFVNEPTGVNWESLDKTRISDGQISAVSVSVNPAGVLYYGTTNGRLFRIDDAGSQGPQVRELTSGHLPSQVYTSCIAIDPRTADHILVAFSNYEIQSLFSSYDGGMSFDYEGGSLEEFSDGSGNGPSVRWVKIVPLTDGSNRYFAGTSTGLYSTDRLEGDKTIWFQESPDLIGNVLVNMIDFRDHDRKLFVATHGNGIFSTTIPDAVPVLPSLERPSFDIGQNYPNPINGGTSIPFTIPEDGMMRIRVYNLSGQFIRDVLWAYQFSGSSTAYWNGRNSAGQPVRPGIYIAKSEYAGQVKSIRMVVQ